MEKLTKIGWVIKGEKPSIRREADEYTLYGVFASRKMCSLYSPDTRPPYKVRVTIEKI